MARRQVRVAIPATHVLTDIMAVAALVPIAPQAARRAHQTQFAGRVMLDTIKLLRVQEFAISAVQMIGKNAGNRQWKQLVKA